MNKILHPLIIGAGGVASYLLPCLVKSFSFESLNVMDKDILEQRNLDRQLFSEAHLGQAKAEALIQILPRNKDLRTDLIPRVEWFHEGTPIGNTDLLICCADNHVARRHCLARADEADIPVIIGGNGYFDSEAYIYFPKWRRSWRDPRVRYPDILTNNEGSPMVSCQGEEQVNHPQLAIANMMCAAKILHLLYLWTTYIQASQLAASTLAQVPIEFFSTCTSSSQQSHNLPPQR